MVDLEKLVVHIKSVEEGQAVVDWFVEQGFYTRGLTPDRYMDFPHFMSNAEDGEPHLLIGTTRISYSSDFTVMEYEEWTGFAEEYNGKNNFEIEDGAFFEVLGLS